MECGFVTTESATRHLWVDALWMCLYFCCVRLSRENTVLVSRRAGGGEGLGWRGRAAPSGSSHTLVWEGRPGTSFSGEVDNDLCWCRGEHLYFKATLTFTVYQERPWLRSSVG